MKAFIAMLLLLALAVFFLAAQSFQQQIFQTDYSPPFTLEKPMPQSGGGSPRRIAPAPSAGTTSTNTGGFQGPSGPPHIVGPSSPPPGQ